MLSFVLKTEEGYKRGPNVDMMRINLLCLALTFIFSGCMLPAYIVNEYLDLPEGLRKKEFKQLVNERNQLISSDLGYVKIFDLVKVSPADKRNKLFLERELFENSYALPKDSLVVSTHVKQLISISRRMAVWPSVYPKVYGGMSKFNSDFWTVWMPHEKQQIIRDSIDQATLPILAVSQYRFDPTYYIVYKQSMKIKKYQQARK
jgi:hypothetical protein